MKNIKIAVIGIGGRTGTMFAFELAKASDVLGIGREIEKEILVERESKREPFLVETISDSNWSTSYIPDIIFLATKNPVSPVIEYYYGKMSDRSDFPTLILSQNGAVVTEEASCALKKALGPNYDKVRIIRLNLFNPIDRKQESNNVIVNYSLPIKVSFGKVSGPGDTKDIKKLFKKAGFEAQEFSAKQIKNMELSKLFFNLIGMPSATRGLSVVEGFEDKESFIEEFLALKEYVGAVEWSGHSFVNFPKYPVKVLSFLIKILPINLLVPFRKNIAQIVSKGREGKPKDLSEIRYYNGIVVDLGKRANVLTPINLKVVSRILK